MRAEKGITLVALVITIIVLLILAVVAIGAITGDGIIPKAESAAKQYNDAQGNETNLLKVYENTYDNVVANIGLQQ